MKLVIDIDEEDYVNICRIGGLFLPKDIVYCFRNATPLPKVLEEIKEEIKDLDVHYDNDYFSSNNDPMYACAEVMAIIDNHLNHNIIKVDIPRYICRTVNRNDTGPAGLTHPKSTGDIYI